MTGNTNSLSATPSEWPGNANRPVEKVSWEDVQIFLTRLDDNAELVVAANLFSYEKPDDELNRYVLQLNGTFKRKGVCFGIRNKHLVLSYIRPVQGLDPDELEWIIASIAVIADEYDDFLINKFRISY